MMYLIRTIAVGAGIHLLWIYLVAVSLVTFCFYGIDKRQAIHHNGRIPEAWLHLLALAGGTIGAFIGQQFFRHKTKKWKFRLIFIIIAVLQAGFIAWWILNNTA